MTPPTPKPDIAGLATDALARLARDEKVRIELPGGGRLQLDCRLPYLCVYRRAADEADRGTEALVESELAQMVVPAEARPAAQALQLLRSIVAQQAGEFGRFLLVEIWSAPLEKHSDAAPGRNGSTDAGTPYFEIVAPTAHLPRPTAEALAKSLGKHSLPLGSAEIALAPPERMAPPGKKPLIRLSDLKDLNCYLLGIKVRPIYRDDATQAVSSDLLQAVRRNINNALKQAFFAFTRKRASLGLNHYQVLGSRSVVKAVFDVDRQLADIGRSFDVLLQATPVNAEDAWREFRRSRFEKRPDFCYRPLAIDPALLKRQLYLIPVERIDDPTLSFLFRQKQEELDRQITLLSDVDTPRFLPESLQIYGGVSTELLRQATELLDRVPPRQSDDTRHGQLTATEFAQRAQQELGYYQQQCADFAGTVAVRDDLYAGMMVSGHQLLVGGKLCVPKRRVEALLQHEVGTHLVTRYNGHVQPFQQLEIGLAGYDGLQEGLAVLAEYLVGGLSRTRMRVLAARVIAAHQMLDRATFVDCFRALDRTYEFPQRAAYTITMRVYRGGGMTKDAVYLRGLIQILRYLREGGELDPLFVGKIAATHLPLLHELRLRQILKPPTLRPRYLENPEALRKIEELRGGKSVLDLIQR